MTADFANHGHGQGPDPVIAFSSPRGQALLLGAAPGLVNWSALESAVTQDNPCFCGPAALLTALRSAHRAGTGHTGDTRQAYPASQDALFEGPLGRVCTRRQVLGRDERQWDDGAFRGTVTYAGMAIEELTRALDLCFQSASLTYAGNASSAAFEAWLMACGTRPAILNFLGSHLGLPLGGHFACVGAYRPDEHRVLILDPARHRVGWYWAAAPALLRAMCVARPGIERPRGWVTVDGRPRAISEQDSRVSATDQGDHR